MDLNELVVFAEVVRAGSFKQIDESVVSYGPFVMDRQQEIVRALVISARSGP